MELAEPKLAKLEFAELELAKLETAELETADRLISKTGLAVIAKLVVDGNGLDGDKSFV